MPKKERIFNHAGLSGMVLFIFNSHAISHFQCSCGTPAKLESKTMSDIFPEMLHVPNVHELDGYWLIQPNLNRKGFVANKRHKAEVISLTTASLEIGVTKDNLRRAVEEDKIPAMRNGKVTYLFVEDVVFIKRILNPNLSIEIRNEFYTAIWEVNALRAEQFGARVDTEKMFNHA